MRRILPEDWSAAEQESRRASTAMAWRNVVSNGYLVVSANKRAQSGFECLRQLNNIIESMRHTFETLLDS